MLRRKNAPQKNSEPNQVPRDETGLIDLGRVSEQTKICGYPKETRDNIFTGCKGPYVS